MALPPDAQAVGNDAWAHARAQGCDCEPHVEISPRIAPPFWHAMVNHDEDCALVRRLIREGHDL